MAKIKSNYLSKLTGKIYGDITFQHKKQTGENIYGKKPTHKDRNSAKQQQVREAYTRLNNIFRFADWVDPAGYMLLERKYHLTKWNLFVMHHMPLMSKSPLFYYGIDEFAGTTLHDYAYEHGGAILDDAELDVTSHYMHFVSFYSKYSMIDVTDIREGTVTKFTIIAMLKLIWRNQTVTIFRTNGGDIWLGALGNQAPNLTLRLYRNGTKFHEHKVYAAYTNTIKLIAVTWDGKKSRIYIHDLITDEKENATDDNIEWTDYKEAEIGFQGGGSEDYYRGSIYKFAFYDHVLSIRQIKQACTALKKWARYALYI